LTLPSAAEALAQAKATLLNAEQAYTRASKLAGDGYSSRATLDEATKALNIAQAQVRNAEFQVFTNKPGGSDYVMAETLLDQAKSALVSAHSRLSYTTIKAQRDGVLISRAVEAGNVVQPANVLMTLSPTGATQLVIQVDEKNLGLIALGQHALASADAFPKDTFVAEVAYINPAIDLQRASVEVKLAVPDPPVYLRQDMTVSVDIEAGRHAEALVVPASVIEGITSKTPWVMKIAGRRAVRTPVKVGLTSGGKAEILNGLAAGDVLAAQPLTLKNGARARAKPSPAARS
jgi:HlyD family secretion protein